MDFQTMTNKVFGKKSHEVIEVLGKKLGGENFKNEDEFLEKVSVVLEERLNHLHVAELCFCNDFWLRRIVQLRENTKDKKYIQYLISLLSHMSQDILEKSPYELKDGEEETLKEYTTFYLKEEFKKENDYYDEIYNQ